jgi:hypothetical protein
MPQKAATNPISPSAQAAENQAQGPCFGQIYFGSRSTKTCVNPTNIHFRAESARPKYPQHGEKRNEIEFKISENRDLILKNNSENIVEILLLNLLLPNFEHNKYFR